jgi:hypothetical protein
MENLHILYRVFTFNEMGNSNPFIYVEFDKTPHNMQGSQTVKG